MEKDNTGEIRLDELCMLLSLATLDLLKLIEERRGGLVLLDKKLEVEELQRKIHVCKELLKKSA